MPKWGYNVKTNLRLRQNRYDEQYHQMKRPQDFAEEDEEPSPTDQGIPDPFESESEDEADYGHWEIKL